MKNTTSQWLELKLKDGVTMKDVYLSIYTHFTMYSSCIDEGYSLAFYKPANHRSGEPGARCYIKADHSGFYDSCIKYYSARFHITPLEGDFRVPDNYELAHGYDHAEMATAKAG